MILHKNKKIINARLFCSVKKHTNSKFIDWLTNNNTPFVVCCKQQQQPHTIGIIRISLPQPTLAVASDTSFIICSNLAVSSACLWLCNAIFSLNFLGLFAIVATTNLLSQKQHNTHTHIHTDTARARFPSINCYYFLLVSMSLTTTRSLESWSNNNNNQYSCLV